MTIVYCVIPYKTPWCALGFFHGMILLAGIGAAALLRPASGSLAAEDACAPGGARLFQLLKSYGFTALAAVVLFSVAAELRWQAWRAAFVDYEDPRAPHVYAHTTDDIMPLVQKVERIAASHPDGRDMHIQVICPDYDFWPLRWYLRDFSRVECFSEPPDRTPAPVVIMQPSMKQRVLKYLYIDQPPGKRPLYADVSPDAQTPIWQLRPGVPLEMFVLRSFWLEIEAAENP